MCLAVVPREAAADALGVAIGDIVAEATDPSVQLICRYAAGSAGDALILTITAEDPATAYERDLEIATSHGQSPEELGGIGERAFYAAAAADAPEQVVFTKGPAVGRIWNQTSATAGQAALAELATLVAATIEAEIRP